jgi:hypothetical protein
MPNKPTPRYSRYVTPSTEPDCVKFWDRELSSTPLWIDWTLLKSLLEAQIPEIQAELGGTKQSATKVLWTAFIEATCGDEESPCHPVYRNFMRSMDEYYFAYWIPRLTIGSDIHEGFSEKVAKQRYANWLADDPQNPVFGRYRVSANLEITEIKKTRRRRKK